MAFWSYVVVMHEIQCVGADFPHKTTGTTDEEDMLEESEPVHSIQISGYSNTTCVTQEAQTLLLLGTLHPLHLFSHL